MGSGVLNINLLMTVQPPMTQPQVFNIFNQLFNVSSGIYIRDAILVSHTAETAIPMGQVAAAGYFCFYNADPTNFITIYTGNAGTAFCKLNAGWAGVFPLTPTLTPYAQADTADCQFEYAIYSR